MGMPKAQLPFGVWQRTNRWSQKRDILYAYRSQTRTHSQSSSYVNDHGHGQPHKTLTLTRAKQRNGNLQTVILVHKMHSFINAQSLIQSRFRLKQATIKKNMFPYSVRKLSVGLPAAVTRRQNQPLTKSVTKRLTPAHFHWQINMNTVTALSFQCYTAFRLRKKLYSILE